MCSKANLCPGFTPFWGILSPIQVYIFEIYVKFCVFLISILRGFEKNVFGPLLCASALFAAAKGRVRAIKKFVFAGFACFASK
jgi:hypothetical protein